MKPVFSRLDTQGRIQIVKTPSSLLQQMIRAESPTSITADTCRRRLSGLPLKLEGQWSYQLSVEVQKKTGYITNKGKKLIISDLISIERTSNESSTDGKSGKMATINNIGLDILNKNLEGYKDSALGTVVFNKTGLPKSDCETYRSVAEINEGMLYRFKLDDFSIFKYTRDNETVAVTLNQ